MDFTTDRLSAEPLSLDHLGDLTALHLDPEVSRYLGGVRSPAETDQYLKANLAHWAAHGFGLWIVRTLDGRFAGRAGIRHTEVEGTPEVEIAYTLHRSLWGQGLATEVAQALVRMWQAHRLSPSLVGIASLDNAPSRRVLEKVGFAYEREAIYHDTPVVIYRMR